MSGNRNITAHTNADNRNSNNNNVRTNINGEVPRLGELALRVLLLKNNLFRTSSHREKDAYERYGSLPFLQSIADANPDEVKKFLFQCPELAVSAYGTVKGASGDIYENYSAIELAYVMDDDELIRDILLRAILKLPPDKMKEAETQLANKMAEVEKQRVQFKPYDFRKIVKAIAVDQTLEETGEANKATKQVLEKFKRDFTPGVITQGKSWIKEHLQEAYRVYDENWHITWNNGQLRWYLIHVIAHLQTRVEKRFEQECSQGLDDIATPKKRNARSVKIENQINDVPLTYRGSADSSLVLSRDFFVEILYGVGVAQCGPWQGGMGRAGYIERLCRTKKSAMETIRQQFGRELRQQHSAHHHKR